jgi:chromosome segregation protein
VVVTPAGQRLDRPGAALVGGGDRDQGASVLARRNELNERQAELDAAEDALARAEDDRRRAEAELTSLEEELRAAAAVCKDVEQRLVNRQQELYRLGEAANLKQRQLEGLEFDAGEIWTELERCNTETDQVRAELDQGRDAERELEEKLARAQEDLDARRQALERARELENEIRLAEASLASEAEHAGREAGRLIREVESSEQRFQELGREIEAAEGLVEDLGSRRQEQQTRLGELYQQLDDLEQSHRQAR